MSVARRVDVCVIGAGPAGHQAAMQAARAGASVLVVERETDVGGACVHRGTIPSKTLRETALSLATFQRKSGDVFPVSISDDVRVASLTARLERVIRAHTGQMAETLRRSGIEAWHGRARFVDPGTVCVEDVHGRTRGVEARVFVVATGSRPRTPPDVPVDHEHVLDSDSILSLVYLPRSLAVLGGGVIASEYASIFAALGVEVTILEARDRPLGFLDAAVVERFLRRFEEMGGRFVGGARLRRVEWNGLDAVEVETEGGGTLRAEKVLCCLGRVANVEGLDLEKAGVRLTDRGHVEVDEHFHTGSAGIYAVGDVIGPPALASTSMDQGRRAVCHALGLPEPHPPETIPVGIYTIPEIASVGLGADEAKERPGGCRVARVGFERIARGHIADVPEGMLQLVCDGAGRRILGVQIVGEGASELIHVGQMAILHGDEVDVFVENTFNFPTLAEAYRLAALEIVWEREGAAGPRPEVCTSA